MMDIISSKKKSICFLTVRGPSITFLNVFILIFAPMWANFQLTYSGGESYFIQTNGYKIPTNVQVAKSSSVSAVNDLVFLGVTLISGPLYDIIGRKKPSVFFYLCVSIGWVILPLNFGADVKNPQESTLWFGYFISNALIGLSAKILTLPYIPDIILEES